MRCAVVPSLLLACAALQPEPARAQAAPDTTCTYSRCALRVDYGFFSTRLVRGSTGDRVARLGWFGGGVDVLLAASDSAAFYARQYRTRRKTADALGVATGALLLVGLTSGEDFYEGGPFVLAALTLELVSLPFVFGIRRSLDRSVWWYNRDLPRP
jgi:hypothetical protein